MNQILHINNYSYNENSNNSSVRKKSKFKIQFFSSIILLLLIIVAYFINLQIKNKKELTARKITNNYNIEKLYSANETSSAKVYSHGNEIFTVIGMIEIPKINIYYPIISEANDELLKISPCRISGPMPNEDGNLCIAGHNYDNYKFFSKLSNLGLNDTVIIYDINGSKLLYRIYDIYEVTANNLSPLNITEGIKKEVTLITCNNFTSDNRIIIKAYAVEN